MKTAGKILISEQVVILLVTQCRCSTITFGRMSLLVTTTSASPDSESGGFEQMSDAVYYRAIWHRKLHAAWEQRTPVPTALTIIYHFDWKGRLETCGEREPNSFPTRA